MNPQKLLFTLLITTPLLSIAQPRSETDLMLAIFKSEKRAYVEETLGIYDEKDSLSFWPVYEE